MTVHARLSFFLLRNSYYGSPIALRNPSGTDKLESMLQSETLFMSPGIYRFPGSSAAQLREVGGKALSLIKMSNAGLPVPPGFVLAVWFFEPWIDILEASEEWSAFRRASDHELKACCDRLKERASNLSFDAGQAECVLRAMRYFAKGTLFAVRSSSPQEDLQGSSFAGGYETVLGVTRKMMEEAVRRAFVSCFDYRVAIYKKEHGLDFREPRIAVVVQAQIASDVAGVGFSLNPVTNSYDDLVINSNWGLGETVVAGMATPDTFIVDKVTMTLVSRAIGGKEVSIWSRADGGTETRAKYRSADSTLADSQVLELARLVDRIEKSSGQPMDVEWAIAGDRIYLLQSRPITTHVPLPPELVTAPGRRKRLYVDATISVQALQKPLSVMSTAVINAMLRLVTKRQPQSERGANPWPLRAYITQGRIYFDASLAIKLMGKEKFCSLLANVDPLAAAAVYQVDEIVYEAEGHPDVSFGLWALSRLPRFAGGLLQARMWPAKSHERAQKEIARYMQNARSLAEQDLPVHEFADSLLEQTAELLYEHVAPLFVASRIVLERLKKTAGVQRVHTVERLQRALPHNPTVEMGLSLSDLSALVPGDLTVDALARGIVSRRMPDSFLAAWDEFLDKYGHRCAGELDIASPRYRENPRMLLEQLVVLRRSTTPDDNPRLRYQRNAADRQAAYGQLCQELRHRGISALRRFKSLYRGWQILGGYREAPKFCLIFAIDLLRQRLLREANFLYRAGRLQRPEQIFDLTLDNLKYELLNPKSDLAGLAEVKREFIDRLARVAQLPTVIDSRGLIFRPPAPQLREGEVSGTPVSSGVIRGPVKVLHSPDDKPLDRGDILVARATDPGWTPLFVNAAGLILEIGGVLQHGALVAREYGLPCVAGVAGATTLWPDGTIVELDGSTGIIREVPS